MENSVQSLLLQVKSLRMFKDYIYNVLLGVDQLINCLIGGDPDLSLSSNIAHSIYTPGLKPRWNFIYELEYLINLLFDNRLYTLETNHVLNAFEFYELNDKALLMIYKVSDRAEYSKWLNEIYNEVPQNGLISRVKNRPSSTDQ